MLKLALMDQFVAVYENVVPADLCDEMVAKFDACPFRAPGKVGGNVNLERKRSTDITMNVHEEWTDILMRFQKAIFPGIKDYAERNRHLLVGAVTPTLRDPKSGNQLSVTNDTWDKIDEGMGGKLAESLIEMIYRLGFTNVQKYDQGVGGYHHWHSETYPRAGTVEPLHRVLLHAVYLNDVAEGGETEFFYQKLKVKPKKGALLIAPASWTHTHRGNIPISGDKYFATSWIKFQPAEVLYGTPRVT